MALLRVETMMTRYVSIEDMPTVWATVNNRRRRQIDHQRLADLFTQMNVLVMRAFIEAPHARPGQGVTSAFSFGYACSAPRQCCACAHIPTTMVRPAVWKADLGLPADKDVCRKRAIQLFPHAASALGRSQDHNRAEAMLLAWWGLQKGEPGT